MSKSELEELFSMQLDTLGLTGYLREYSAVKGRKFRWDFCWEQAKLLAEINGGTFTKGAHSTGTGIRRDYEKNNLAQLAGWRCLMFDGEMVRSGEAVEIVRKALEHNE